MKNIFSFLLLLILLSISLQAAKPSTKKIKHWLGQSRFSISKMDRVYLYDNERAFLAHINFDTEDLIINKALVLVRPELEEAEFIANFSFDYKIIDLNHDGISEIIYSNQTQEEDYNLTTYTVAQLHDYKITKLYERSAKEQTKCTLCLKESLSWKIKDLNKDKIKDIQESYILSLSNANKTIIIQENEKKIIFHKNTFSPNVKKTKTLEKMLISHDVKKRQAIQESKEFNLNDPQVACFLDFKKVHKKEKISYYWINKNLEKVLRREQTIMPATRYRTWMFKSIKEKDSYLGSWIVVLLNQDKSLLSSKEFFINKPVSFEDVNVSQESTQDNNLTNVDLNLTETKHLSELILP